MSRARSNQLMYKCDISKFKYAIYTRSVFILVTRVLIITYTMENTDCTAGNQLEHLVYKVEKKIGASFEE